MRKKQIGLFLLLAFLSASLFAQEEKQPPGIHYFYNSGWLVETTRHLLVFDFVPDPKAGVSFADLQKRINETSANKPLLVFISHNHPDHFTDSIFTLQQQARTMRFILGWKPTSPPAVKNLSLLFPGDSLVQNDLSVFTHPATDDGSAFLVTIDDLTIYHAGDHALWVEEIAGDYTAPLEKFRTKALRIDLAFLPAARGLMMGCAVDSVMEKSVCLAATILQPKKVALQHIGCTDALHRYKQVRQNLTALKVDWIIPEAFNSRVY
ncbi:MBL fold metallo-hydrolase [Flavisolibacter sp. BT320]|nr:MBL fold metallo-hydrolase [Flavisolibacter longurius]